MIINHTEAGQIAHKIINNIISTEDVANAIWPAVQAAMAEMLRSSIESRCRDLIEYLSFSDGCYRWGINPLPRLREIAARLSDLNADFGDTKVEYRKGLDKILTKVLVSSDYILVTNRQVVVSIEVGDRLGKLIRMASPPLANGKI